MNSLKSILKCSFFALIWAIACIGIAFGIGNVTAYNIQDVLFVEGMVLLGLSILSSVSGNSNGISFGALGQNNAQYVMNANLAVTEKERTLNSLKADFKMGFSSTVLVLAGVFCIIANFIL